MGLAVRHTRRALLRAGMIAPLTAACAPDVLLGDPGVVRVGVSWSGAELAAFRTVLAGLAPTYPVEVVPLGDDIDTAFTAGGRSAPDLVMLPQPGRLAELVRLRKVRPVAPALWSDAEGPRYAEHWGQLLFHGGKPYGVPFKAADKSLVWYDREQIARYRLGEPENWTLADWLDRMEFLAETPSRLLALGAADGWVLTDVFENVLLAESPRYYDELAAARGDRSWDNPAVRAALRHLGTLWGHRHAFPGGVAATLTRQFPDALREVFEYRRAVLVVMPDFAEPIVRSGLRRARRPESAVGVTAFPPVRAALAPPRIVGGDVMVITASANRRTEELVAALADPAAPLPWLERAGGFITPNMRATPRYSELMAPFARQINARSAFDLSDRIGAVGGRNGLWRILTDFLVTVGDGRTQRLGAAIDRAVDAMDAFERRRR